MQGSDQSYVRGFPEVQSALVLAVAFETGLHEADRQSESPTVFWYLDKVVRFLEPFRAEAAFLLCPMQLEPGKTRK